MPGLTLLGIVVRAPRAAHTALAADVRETRSLTSMSRAWSSSIRQCLAWGPSPDAMLVDTASRYRIVLTARLLLNAVTSRCAAMSHPPVTLEMTHEGGVIKMGRPSKAALSRAGSSLAFVTSSNSAKSKAGSALDKG